LQSPSTEHQRFPNLKPDAQQQAPQVPKIEEEVLSQGEADMQSFVN
jgi:hypothetical protein